jgi:hypothetical protein
LVWRKKLSFGENSCKFGEKLSTDMTGMDSEFESEINAEVATEKMDESGLVEWPSARSAAN